MGVAEWMAIKGAVEGAGDVYSQGLIEKNRAREEAKRIRNQAMLSYYMDKMQKGQLRKPGKTRIGTDYKIAEQPDIRGKLDLKREPGTFSIGESLKDRSRDFARPTLEIEPSKALTTQEEFDVIDAIIKGKALDDVVIEPTKPPKGMVPSKYVSPEGITYAQPSAEPEDFVNMLAQEAAKEIREIGFEAYKLKYPNTWRYGLKAADALPSLSPAEIIAGLQTMPGGGPPPLPNKIPTFKTIEEAEAANLPSGTIVEVNGKRFKVE